MGYKSDWANQHVICNCDWQFYPVLGETVIANSQGDFSRNVICDFSAIVWQALNSF